MLRRLAEETSDAVQKRTLQLWSSKQGTDLYTKHIMEVWFAPFPTWAVPVDNCQNYVVNFKKTRNNDRPTFSSRDHVEKK